VSDLGAANHIDAQVRAQRSGHDDAAVGLQVVFKDRQPGAADRKSATVDGVQDFLPGEKDSFLALVLERLAGGTEQAA
jgi:hypothetical protein